MTAGGRGDPSRAGQRPHRRRVPAASGRRAGSPGLASLRRPLRAGPPPRPGAGRRYRSRPAPPASPGRHREDTSAGLEPPSPVRRPRGRRSRAAMPPSALPPRGPTGAPAAVETHPVGELHRAAARAPPLSPRPPAGPQQPLPGRTETPRHSAPRGPEERRRPWRSPRPQARPPPPPPPAPRPEAQPAQHHPLPQPRPLAPAPPHHPSHAPKRSLTRHRLSVTPLPCPLPTRGGPRPPRPEAGPEVTAPPPRSHLWDSLVSRARAERAPRPRTLHRKWKGQTPRLI